MNRTRREFGLSGLGIGAALTSMTGVGLSKDRDASGTVLLHEDPQSSCFEVNLAKANGNHVVAAFARGAVGAEIGDIVLTRSRDGGKTWTTTPTVLFSREDSDAAHQGYQSAGIARLRDGTLIANTTAFRFLFGGKVRWRRGSETGGVYIRRSADGGHSWDVVRKVATDPFRIAWTRGSIVEMPDGSLLLPLAGQKGSRYQDAHETIVSFLMRSTDRGANWNYHATIARDVSGARDYDEASIVALDGGKRLLCALRSHESPRRDPPGGYIYMTVSGDGGATWTTPRKSSMWGHPAHLLGLADGRVLCTYGYRMHPDPGVRACVSDDGLHWKPQGIFTVKAFPDLDSDRLQIGSPSSLELEPGRILTAHHVWAAAERQCLQGSFHRV